MDELTDFLKKPINIILVGAVIATVGGIITFIGTYLHNRNSSEKSNRIEKGVNEGIEIGRSTSSDTRYLRIQNARLTSKIDLQGQTIDDLRRENTDLYEELREANKIITNNVRGGQDPLYVEAVEINKGIYQFWLNNPNEYSVFGLVFEMIDYDELMKCKHVVQREKYIVDYPCFRQLSQGFNKDELGNGQMYLSWGNSDFSNITFKDYGRYQIRIKTKNKVFYQQLVYRKVGSDIYTASRVLISENPLSDKGDFKSVKTVESTLAGWNVNFNDEFPSGVIFHYAPL